MTKPLRPMHRFGLLASLLIASASLVAPSVAPAATQVSVDTGSYVLISSVRFSRFEFDYTYTAQAVNSGTTAASSCTATLSSSSPHQTVLDGSLSFGSIAAGARVTSTDTFTFRQDRQFPFDPSALSWQVQCAAANTAPVANAGADQTVFTGITVTLNGSGSSDADGDPLTFAWTLTVKPAGSTATLDNPTAVMPKFVADRDGEYRAQLVVNDGHVNSTADVVIVTTIPQNTPPVANAGPDQQAFVGDVVTLNGTGSSDVDGDPLTFAWAFLSRPAGSTASLTGAATATPTFTPDVAGDYTVRLTVNDGRGGSNSDSVLITTQVRNRAPIANAGPDQAVSVGQTVHLTGAASSDPDGDPLTFAWSFVTRPTGSTATLLNANTVTPSFVADRAGNFVVQLIVNDGHLSSTPDTVLISTSNTPPVANAGPDQTVDPGTTVQLDGTASSDANNDPLSFLWSLTTRPAGSTATITNPLIPNPTFVADRAGLYVAQLIVNDGFIDSAPDTVNITARNRQPDAVDDSATTQTGVPITINVLANDTDPDGDTLSVSAVTQPANGTVVNNGTNLTFTPAAGFSGTTTFTYTVSDGHNGSDTATVTVTVNALPVVSIVATDANAAEQGLDTGTFTVSRTGATTSSLTVNYSIGGNATNGTDYQTISGTVVIASGQASATITITPIEDTSNEGTESVTLAIQSNSAYTIGAANSATVNIADNDTPTVTIVASDASASEAGSNTATFTISRTGDSSSALTVLINVAGTASQGADYSSLPASVPLSAGQTSATLTVTPLADNLVEGDETVIVSIGASGTYSTGTPATATVTITDNPASVSVTASDANATEPPANDTGTFTFTRTGGDLTAALSVSFAVSGSATSGSDYTAIGAVTIPANQSSVTATVTPLADNLVETPETVVVTLAASANHQVGAPNSATVTITDTPVVVTIQATDPNASETGPDTGTFTITRAGGNITQALTVQYTRGGTATEGADFTALPATFTIPANQTSAAVTVTPLADSLVEPDETVIITLTGTTNYNVGTPGSATVTIADAVLPTVTVTATDANAAETGLNPGVFTFTRTGATTNSLTVNFTLGGSATNGTDYQTITTSVSIGAGQASATVTVTPIDDTLSEGDETVVLTLASNANYSVGTPGSATVTIADNDVPQVSVAATDPNASETGNDTGTFTFTRTGSTALALPITFTIGGTAINGTDYNTNLPTSVGSGTLTFSAGQATATLTITPLADAIVEGSETAIITVVDGADYDVGTPGNATVTIADASASISVSPTIVNMFTSDVQGMTVTLSSPAGAGGQVVTLQSSNTGSVTVPANVTVQANQTVAGFQATATTTSGTATITASAAGLTSGTATVNVANRGVNVVLASSLVGVGRSTTGTVTIQQPAPSAGVDLTISSGNTGIATVTPTSAHIASGSTQANITVNGVAPGTTAISASGTGFTTGSANVTVTNNLISINAIPNVAPAQTLAFAVSLSQPAPAGGVTINFTSANPGIATVTPSVTVPAGQQTPTANPQVTGVDIGTTAINATATGFAPDSRNVVVTLVMTFSPATLSVNQSNTQNITLNLSAPAPTFGLAIALTTDNNATATVPASVTVPQGQNSIQIPVTGVAIGSTTLRANSPGIAEATAAINVTAAPAINIADQSVGRDLEIGVSGSLAANAPPVVGVDVTLTSSDPSRLLISTDGNVVGGTSIVVHVAGGLASIPQFFLQSLVATGSVTLTASAPGYATDTSIVTLTPSGFIINSPSLINTNTFAANSTVQITAARLAAGTLMFNANQAVRPGVTVQVPVTSSDTNVGTITVSPVSFTGNVGTVNTAFDPAGAGTSTITVGTPAGFDTPANFRTITATVTAPAITITANPHVGEDLQDGVNINLSTAPPSAVDITVTVASGTIARVSDTATVLGGTTVVFPAVTTTAARTVIIQGLLQGSTTLTISAPGYATNTQTLTVDPSGFIINSPGLINTNTFAVNTSVQITAARLTPGTLNFASNQQVRAGLAAPVSVAVTSSDTNVGTITVSPVTFAAGVGSVNTAFDPVGAGTSTLAVTTPAGFDTPANFRTITATVTAPVINFTANPHVGEDLQDGVNINLSTAPPSAVDITVTVADSTIARLSDTATVLGGATVVFPNVTTTAARTLTVQGLLQGSTTLTISAPGYTTVNTTVTVDPSGFIINSPGAINTNTFATNTGMTITPARLTPGSLTFAANQAVRAGLAAPVSVAVTSSDPNVGSITVSPVTFAANATTASTAFDPATAGTTTVAVAPPAGFDTPANFRTLLATVTAPSINFTANPRVGEDLEENFNVNLATAPPNAVDITITITSGTIARVNDSATVLGTTTLVIPGVTTTSGHTIFLQGLLQGSTTVTVSAPGYASNTQTLTVDPSGFIINTPGAINTTAGAANATLQITAARLTPGTLNFASNELVRPGLAGAVQVPVVSSNTTVGTITISPLSFNAGIGSVNTAFDPATAGVTTLTVNTPSGFDTSNNFRQILATVNP
ncbi:MAG TPA: Calx-beta domain-containing protein [Steroidobacteraceae bacterium]|nr:Calx-beta domain-containing protein [Steroidobacteraceae bacterium]